MLKVEVVTPEQRVWSGEAKMVSARTLEGDLGVLPGHAPLLGVLADGTVSIKSADGSVNDFLLMVDLSLFQKIEYLFSVRVLTKL